MGSVAWGSFRGFGLLPLVVCCALFAPRWNAFAGLVDFELRPAQQTVVIGDSVDVGLYIVSADGADQQVGFVTTVLVWDETALLLAGNVDNGPFAWSFSGFPWNEAGLNESFADGDAYYQATVVPGGPYATATADGTLVTTFQFTALSTATASTSITIIACVGSTCSRVLDANPIDPGVTDVTGDLGKPAQVTIICQVDSDCDDGNPCTDDTCDASNVCVNTPNDNNDPDDGLFCNGREICVAGQVEVEPGSVPDCDDGLPCTTDECNETTDQCDHPLEGGFCLIGGGCVVEGDVDPANDCYHCDPALDPLDWSFRPLGAPCGDPNEADCDHADTCDGSGLCKNNLEPEGTPCGDPSDNTCTAPDTCDGAGICKPNHRSDGIPCDDGLFCTTTDACAAGVCTGTGDACPNRVCDEATDTCKAVNLELIPVQQGPVAVGETVEIDLYAASDTGVDQPISALETILVWEASKLELLGHVDNGPYVWLLSSFPDDSGLDGLNNTFLDGNAIYEAISGLPPAVATPAGLLVTTLQFRALASGPTSLQIVESMGMYTQSRVFDGETIGLVITGTLGSAALDVVECLDDPACDDGEFCNGTEACVNMECVPGTPPDCDDGVFCNGVETCEFGVGCQSPGNPCPEPASCDEDNDNCGGCDASTVLTEGSRYLAVTPSPGVDPVAILITGSPEDVTVACVSMYVQADGSLGVSPVYRTPGEWGTVHVTGSEIIPDKTFMVNTDCRVDGSGYLSAPSFATTWVWGDVNGNGYAFIDDVDLVVQGSQGIFVGDTTLENLDMAPCLPDGVIDDADIEAVLAAFSGDPFPCPIPCEACVSIDPPELDVTAVAENRYLSFKAGNPGRNTAIRVTLVSLPAPFDAWTGMSLFVGQPYQVCENSGQDVSVAPPACAPAPGLAQGWFWVAPLVCDPQDAHFMDWSTLGNHCVGDSNDGGPCVDDSDCPGFGSCGSSDVIHLYHEGIIPSKMMTGTGPIETPAQYDVQVVDERCPLHLEHSYSDPLRITQAGWGDAVEDCSACPCGPPDETVDVVTDVVSLMMKFTNDYCAPKKTRTDLQPKDVDFIIDVSDIVQCVNAFLGYHYDRVSGAGQCIEGFCTGGIDDGAACQSDTDCSSSLCP